MLRQRIREIRKNDKGFTLIELLIVIVILGVLAGIVVFAVGAFNDRGVKAACKSDLTTVETAVEAFRAKTGAYPAGADSPARLAVLTGGDYLKSAPSNVEYTIAITDDAGTVTSNLAGAPCK